MTSNDRDDVRGKAREIAALAMAGGLVYGMNFSVLAAVLPVLRTGALFSEGELSLLSASRQGTVPLSSLS